METKTTRNLKRETSSRVWKNVQIDGDLRNEEIPRASGRTEPENEVQLMWTCGTLGERISAKNRRKVTKEVRKEANSGTNEQFPKETGREAYFCDWRFGNEPRIQCFFERHGSLLDRICRHREQRCSLLEKARKMSLERNRVCGEFETMLNSCPGKGVVDTGCAKMMMRSDTFRQYLKLRRSKARASDERAQEKNRFRLRDNETGLLGGLQSFR